MEVLDMEVFLERYGACWNTLIEAANHTSPFVTLEWLKTWWEAFGEPGTERIVVISDANANPVCLVFFRQQRTRRRYFTSRVLTGWVNGQCPRTPILTLGDGTLAAEELVTWLIERRREWDVAKIGQFPHGEAKLAHLADHVLARRGLNHIVQSKPISRIVVRGSWEEFYKTVSKKTRHEQERLERRLQDKGKCEWRKFQGKQQVLRALAIYLKMEQRSWKATHGQIISDHPALVCFYRSLAEQFGARNAFEVDILFFDGEAIAGSLSVLHDDCLYVLKTSYDDEYRRFSPGGWIMFKPMIQDAFERGLKEIDFCNRKPFTVRWTKDPRNFVDITIYSPTVRGRMVRARQRFK